MPGGGGPAGQCPGRGRGREESPWQRGRGGLGGTKEGGGSQHPCPLRGLPARPRGALRPAGGPRQGGPSPSLPSLPRLPPAARAGARCGPQSPAGGCHGFPGHMCARFPRRGGRREAAGAGRLQSRTGPPPRQAWGEAEREATAAAEAAREPLPPADPPPLPLPLPAPLRSHLRRRPPLSRCPRAIRSGAPRRRAADPRPRPLPPPPPPLPFPSPSPFPARLPPPRPAPA